jgi:SAM-dependent methyltransferase
VDRLVSRGLTCLSVLDISAAALARAKARLGPAAAGVRWIEADVTGEWRSDPVDVWHDRAVFHFLTDAEDRSRYLTRARQQIKPGGRLILATFAPDGPARCSGLPVLRYTPTELAAELGASFALERSLNERHVTPSGSVQSFTFAVFRSRGAEGHGREHSKEP